MYDDSCYLQSVTPRVPGLEQCTQIASALPYRQDRIMLRTFSRPEELAPFTMMETGEISSRYRPIISGKTALIRAVSKKDARACLAYTKKAKSIEAYLKAIMKSKAQNWHEKEKVKEMQLIDADYTAIVAGLEKLFRKKG